MFSRSTWLHLRFPFSYFLLPVYLFALGNSPNYYNSSNGLLWVFILLHFFLYPASNGYNSYFDKDEKSIGGIKNPPPVKRELYWVSLILEATGLIIAYFKIGILFALMYLVYGLVSKAYSHPSVRLKKYPITGWLVTSTFQGFFTFLMCYIGINEFDMGNLMHLKVMFPAVLTSLMLLGNYPMTQIYQHDEDRKHGDYTISLMLGIRGTFIFVQAVFIVAATGFFFFIWDFFQPKLAWTFLIAQSPVVLFFFFWFYRAWFDESRANYSNTMLLNFISATCLNIYFIFFFLVNGNLIQNFTGN